MDQLSIFEQLIKGQSHDILKKYIYLPDESAGSGEYRWWIHRAGGETVSQLVSIIRQVACQISNI
jgi:hypothetical protein